MTQLTLSLVISMTSCKLWSSVNFVAEKHNEAWWDNLPENQSGPTNVQDWVVWVRSQTGWHQEWHLFKLNPSDFKKFWQIDEQGQEGHSSYVKGQFLPVTPIWAYQWFTTDNRIPLMDKGHCHVDGCCYCDGCHWVDQVWEEGYVEVQLWKKIVVTYENFARMYWNNTV